MVLDLGSKNRPPDGQDFSNLHSILSTLRDLRDNTTDKTLSAYCGIAIVGIELAMEAMK